MAETNAAREARERGDVDSGICPVTGLSRATAYQNEGCRCPDCRAWESNRKKHLVPPSDGVAATAIAEVGGVEVIFERIADGISISDIADSLGISRFSLVKFIEQPELADQYRIAKRASAGALMDQATKIVDRDDDTTGAVARDKLRAGHRRHLASVRNPEEYEKSSKVRLEGGESFGYAMLAALNDYGHRDAPGMRRLERQREQERIQEADVEIIEDED